MSQRSQNDRNSEQLQHSSRFNNAVETGRSLGSQSKTGQRNGQELGFKGDANHGFFIDQQLQQEKAETTNLKEEIPIKSPVQSDDHDCHGHSHGGSSEEDVRHFRRAQTFKVDTQKTEIEDIVTSQAMIVPTVEDSNSQNHDEESFESMFDDYAIRGSEYMLKKSVNLPQSKKVNTADSSKEHGSLLNLTSTEIPNLCLNKELNQTEEECDEHEGPDHGIIESDSDQESVALSTESDDSMKDLPDDHESKVHSFIEDFYESNYEVYQLNKIKDYAHESVWAVHFDQIYDRAYIFVARIKVVEFRKKSKNFSPTPSRASPSSSQHGHGHGHGEITPKDLIQKYEIELEGLKIFEGARVDLQLTLQIWNLDDRVLKDKDHRRRAQQEKVIMRTLIDIQQGLNLFQIMQFCKNKYMDHTNLVQHENKLVIPYDFYNIQIYSCGEAVKAEKPIKVFEENTHRAFKAVFHKIEQHPTRKVADPILVFSYEQFVTAKHDHERNEGKVSAGAITRKDTVAQKRLNSKMFGQKLVLTKIQYHESRNQFELDQQDLEIKDDNLISYYENNLTSRELHLLFIQRIEMSETYLILFPTGLLLMAGVNPFIIQSKIQLGLRRDENIIDHSYSISQDGKHHCIWILDQKLQVWKCSNERSPSQVSWTLTREEIFSKLDHRKFFHQATTYDKFYMTSFLTQLKRFKHLEKGHGPRFFDFQVAFNGNATKGLFVHSPAMPQFKFDKGKFQGTSTEYLEYVFKMPIKLLARNRAKIQLLFAKNQTNILNYIPKRKVPKSLMFPSQEPEQFIHIEDKSINRLNRQLTLKEQLEENEILELQCLRSIKIPMTRKGKAVVKEYRQFLIRRKRCLELMYTNGLVHWAIEIPESRVASPFVITDIVISANLLTLLSHCTIPGTQKDSYDKVFTYNQETLNFVRSENLFERSRTDKIIKMVKNSPRNIVVDSLGAVYHINVELIHSEKGSQKGKDQNFRDMVKLTKDGMNINIEMARAICFKELLSPANQMKRLLTSDNGRILMCGKVLIQLNKDGNQIKNIGCIVMKKDHTFFRYIFRSLLEQDSRKIIASLLKKPITLMQIVSFEFTNQPLSPAIDPQTLYFTTPVADAQLGYSEGTSLVKMSTDTLNCVEIYQSKYNIVQFTQFDELKGKQGEMSFKVPISQNEKDKGLDSSLTLEEGDSLTNIVKDLEIDRNGLEGGQQMWQDAKKGQIIEDLNIGGGNFDGPVTLNQGDLFQDRANEKLLKESKNIGFKRKKSTKEAKKLIINDVKQMIKNTIDQGKIYLSLLSQKQGRIFIEMVVDSCLINIDYAETGKHSESFLHLLEHRSHGTHFCRTPECKDILSKYKARLIRTVCVHRNQELNATSEAAWINSEQLILTLDDDFYLLTTDEQQLQSIKNDGVLRFGKQYVNSNLFASVVAAPQKSSKSPSGKHRGSMNRKLTLQRIIGDDTPQITQEIDDERLLRVQDCIQRMEIASLIRLAFVARAQTSIDIDRAMLFFMPCEELKGGSIFQKLAFNFNVIQPYLEKVDAAFLFLLNQRVRNVNNYLQGRFSSGYTNISAKKGSPDLEAGEIALLAAGSSVHMYQEDLSGQNAIDVAFKHSAIFCIRAFVDSVLQINEEAQFKNCFDKAVLLMIKKGLDVTGLVNSELFFAPIWNQYTLFSSSDHLVTKASNLSLQELSLEDPGDIFSEEQFKVDRNMMNSASKDLVLRKKRESRMHISFEQAKNQGDDEAEDEDLTQEDDELERHEIQFRYLNLELIEGKDKRALTQTLKLSEDLDLFEQESIQVIIDYKWETYTKPFFLYQLAFYSFYLVSFFYDMHTLHTQHFDRLKDKAFWWNKIVGLTIHTGYLVYEAAQARIVRWQYFSDSWNLLQLSASVLYLMAAGQDVVQEEVTDSIRILYVACTFLTLSRVLYLLRVFKELSFLVIMLAKVIKDLTYFMIVFGFFIFTFSQCYLLVNVDLAAYGRIPQGLGMFLATARSAFGDFSLIDPYQGFDLKDPIEETEDPEDFKYRHSVPVVFCTFVIWILQSLTLFMVFMNFIIAVISDSYNEVTQRKVAYDYRERVSMILEREIFFNEKNLMNQRLFPKILVVSKRKEGVTEQNSGQNLAKQIKQFIKEQAEMSRNVIYDRSKEQKEHLNNTVKTLEGEIFKTNQNVQKVIEQVEGVASMQRQQQQLMERLAQPQINYDSKSSQYTSDGVLMEMRDGSNYGSFNRGSQIDEGNKRYRKFQHSPKTSKHRNTRSQERRQQNFFKLATSNPSPQPEALIQNEKHLMKKITEQRNEINELSSHNKRLQSQLAEFTRPYLLQPKDPFNGRSSPLPERIPKQSHLSKQKLLNLVPKHDLTGETPLFNSLKKRVASRNSPMQQNLQKIKYPANSLLPDPKRNGKNKFPKLMQAIHREDLDYPKVNNESVISWEQD